MVGWSVKGKVGLMWLLISAVMTEYTTTSHPQSTSLSPRDVSFPLSSRLFGSHLVGGIGATGGGRYFYRT